MRIAIRGIGSATVKPTISFSVAMSFITLTTSDIFIPLGLHPDNLASVIDYPELFLVVLVLALRGVSDIRHNPASVLRMDIILYESVTKLDGIHIYSHLLGVRGYILEDRSAILVLLYHDKALDLRHGR